MGKKTKPPAFDAAQLPNRLLGFATKWQAYSGTEQAGSQSFLRDLLEVYEVDFKPGTIFESHPVRQHAVAAKSSQGALFPGEVSKTQYTRDRMDMYIPKVCIWEMKAPSQHELGKHHQQLLEYWGWMRTQYMVLCNFQEFWIYDTNDDEGQLQPKLKFTLSELPGRGDALLFLRGDVPNLSPRAERVTAEAARYLGFLFRNLVESMPDPERDKKRAAKFLLECVFAMFAEDSELIPPQQFTAAIGQAHKMGKMNAVWSLFGDFSRKDSEEKENEFAPYVNGSLFDRKQPKITLTDEQIHDLYGAAKNVDWLDVSPEIFGSIFEQALGAVDRHNLGAHFTRERHHASCQSDRR